MKQHTDSVTSQTLQGHHFVAEDTGIGPYNTWNGLAEASSDEWIIPVEDDYLLHHDYATTTGKYTDSYDIIYTWVNINHTSITPNRLFNPRALTRYNYIPPCSLVRKKLFTKLGGFQEGKLDPVWSLWLRALKNGARFKCIPEPLWELKLDKASTVALEAVQHYNAVQKPSELEQLLRLVDERKPRVIVEIGTASGGTLWALAQHAHEEAVFLSIDIPGGSPIDIRQGKDVYARKSRDSLADLVQPSQELLLVDKNSQSKAAIDLTKKLLNGRPVDLLFIDGDHRYEGVKADFENFGPLTEGKGIIAFHDIVKHQDPRVGVHKLWNELKQNRPVKEFVTHSNPPWGGVGVLL